MRSSRAVIGSMSVMIGVASPNAQATATHRGTHGSGGPSAGELPPSHRRFWQRVADPDGERAARVAVLASRLMARYQTARGQSEPQERLLAAIVAMAQIAKIEPTRSGELGFYVGHALVTLGRTDAVEARLWLESALRESPGSRLALGAWLDLAQLAAMRDQPQDEFSALSQAAALVTTPTEATTVHRERALAFERRGMLESARRQYQELIEAGLEENSLAQAGWHLALVLDKQGDHPAALRAIDDAEARAYDRPSPNALAVEDPDFRVASQLDRLYIDGLKHWWLALRREQPPPRESLQRALQVFEAAAQWSSPEYLRALKWHLVEIRRALGLVALR